MPGGKQEGSRREAGGKQQEASRGVAGGRQEGSRPGRHLARKLCLLGFQLGVAHFRLVNTSKDYLATKIKLKTNLPWTNISCHASLVLGNFPKVDFMNFIKV